MCVLGKALVMEDKGEWYMSEGGKKKKGDVWKRG